MICKLLVKITCCILWCHFLLWNKLHPRHPESWIPPCNEIVADFQCFKNIFDLQIVPHAKLVWSYLILFASFSTPSTSEKSSPSDSGWYSDSGRDSGSGEEELDSMHGDLDPVHLESKASREMMAFWFDKKCKLMNQKGEVCQSTTPAQWLQNISTCRSAWI